MLVVKNLSLIVGTLGDQMNVLLEHVQDIIDA